MMDTVITIMNELTGNNRTARTLMTAPGPTRMAGSADLHTPGTSPFAGNFLFLAWFRRAGRFEIASAVPRSSPFGAKPWNFFFVVLCFSSTQYQWRAISRVVCFGG